MKVSQWEIEVQILTCRLIGRTPIDSLGNKTGCYMSLVLTLAGGSPSVNLPAGELIKNDNI